MTGKHRILVLLCFGLLLTSLLSFTPLQVQAWNPDTDIVFEYGAESAVLQPPWDSVGAQGSGAKDGTYTFIDTNSSNYHGFVITDSDTRNGRLEHSDFKILADYGFDMVMAYLWWSKIEKWDGTYQTTYINNINQTIDRALAEGLSIFLSFRVSWDDNIDGYYDWWTDWGSTNRPLHDQVNFNQDIGGQGGRTRYSEFLADMTEKFPSATGFCPWHFPYHKQSDETGGRKATYEGATTTAMVNAIRGVDATCKIIWCPTQQGDGNNGERSDWYLTGTPPSACADDTNILYGLGHMTPWDVLNTDEWDYDYGRMDTAFNGVASWTSKYPNKPIISVEYAPMDWNGAEPPLSHSRLSCLEASLERMAEYNVGWAYHRISLGHYGTDDILIESEDFALQPDLLDYLLAGLRLRGRSGDYCIKMHQTSGVGKTKTDAQRRVKNVEYNLGTKELYVSWHGYFDQRWETQDSGSQGSILGGWEIYFGTSSDTWKYYTSGKFVIQASSRSVIFQYRWANDFSDSAELLEETWDSNVDIDDCLNTWMHLQAYINMTTDNSGAVKAWFNGTLVGESTGIKTDPSGYSEWTSKSCEWNTGEYPWLVIGLDQSTTSIKAWYWADDIVGATEEVTSAYGVGEPSIEFENWENGFEEGDFSAWNGTQTSDGEATVTSTYAYQGTYSGNFTADGSLESYARSMFIVQDISEVYMRSYVRFEDLPDTDDSRIMVLRIAQEDSTFIANCGVYRNSTGSYWILRNYASGGTNYYVLDSINADEWYSVEMYFNATSNGNQTLWINNTKILSGTGDFSGLGNIARVYPYIFCGGNNPQATTKTVYHDNFRVDDVHIGGGTPKIFQARAFSITSGQESPLSNVKINGTYLTDTSGCYEWTGLSYNVIYTFVIEKPTGYFAGWCLNVEGAFQWNTTHCILDHNITEAQTDYIEIYFQTSNQTYVQETSSNSRLNAHTMTADSSYGDAFSYSVTGSGWILIQAVGYNIEPYLCGLDILKDGDSVATIGKSYNSTTERINITFSEANTLVLYYTRDKTTTISGNTWFWLFTYDVYVIFSSQKSFSDLYRADDYWIFDDYKFQVQNSNMTVSQLFSNDKLMFNLSASSSAIVKAFIPSSFRDDGNPASVEGASQWSYDEGTRTLLVTSPDSEVTVNWKARAGEPLPVYPYEQPAELPRIQLPDPLVQLSKQGLIVLMGGLGVIAVGGIVASGFTTVKKKKISRQPKGIIKTQSSNLKRLGNKATGSPRGFTGVKARRKKR